MVLTRKPGIRHYQKTPVSDKLIWKLSGNGLFSVHSLYLALVDNNVQFPQISSGKQSCLLKIKVFMWYVCKKVILTKDNLLTRNWKGNSFCCFCSNYANIDDLFFSVAPWLNLFGE